MSGSAHDLSTTNGVDSTLTQHAHAAAQRQHDQDSVFNTDEPPAYTPRPDLRTGEETLEYGPARPFQSAAPPVQRFGGAGGWPPRPPQQLQHQQQQQQAHGWASASGYPGAARRDQIPGGWPPVAPPRRAPVPAPAPAPQASDIGRRPSIYGVFRDGAPARSNSHVQRGSDAPGVKERTPDLAAASRDGRPTTSPVPGHPFLREGKILVYPSTFECHKCLNTGYKNGDPYHPCRGCWDKFAQPYTGAVTYAPYSDMAQSSHAQITLQRPLPRLPPPSSSAPPTLGYMPPQRQPSVYAPPPGAMVVKAGDPRIGGRLCYRCGGEGTISLFIFDITQCPACNGVGRILN